MRFYIGFSKKIPFKLILAGLLALFTFIFGSKLVNAEATQQEFVPTITYYYQYMGNTAYTPTRNLDSVNNLYYFFTTNEFGGYNYNFTYSYGGRDLCNGSNMVLKFNTSLLSYNNTAYNISVEPHYSDGSVFSDLRLVDGSYSNPTFQAIIKPNKAFYFVVNESSGDHHQNPVYEGIISRYWDLSCEYSLEDSTDDIINNNNQNTTDIINNNNQNTTDIINNNNQNTTNIINNQNQIAHQQIESQQVCSYIDKYSIVENGYFNDEGFIYSNAYNSQFNGITDYISISKDTNITLLSKRNVDNYACFYNINKTLISCIDSLNFSVNSSIPIPTNASFFRATIRLDENKPTYNICVNGNQALSDNINNLNDSLNNDSVNGAIDTGNDFFDNFHIDDSRGFSAIVTAPIQFLRDLLTSQSSCSPLNIGFSPSDGTHSGNASWSIPCGDILWSKAPSSVILIWETLIWGILGYRVLVDLFKFVQRMLDPEDKSEFVMRL